MENGSLKITAAWPEGEELRRDECIRHTVPRDSGLARGVPRIRIWDRISRQLRHWN
jgi:hypothetical protein